MKRFAHIAILAGAFGCICAPAFADNAKAPDTSRDLVAHSRIAESKGQMDEAVMLLQALIVADPAKPSSYVLLADFYARNNQPGTARAYYDDALFIDPVQPQALKGVAMADLKLGKEDAAQASLDRLIETCGPRCPETLSVREALEQSKKLGADAASTALDKH